MMQVSGVVDLSPICSKSNLPFTAVSFVYFAHEATYFFTLMLSGYQGP